MSSGGVAQQDLVKTPGQTATLFRRSRLGSVDSLVKAGRCCVIAHENRADTIWQALQKTHGKSRIPYSR
jgi:hypothetical protein